MVRILSQARAPRTEAITQRLVALSRRYLRQLGLGHHELSLSVVTDAEIRAINRDWRHKDKATDVLSFPAGDGPLPPGEPTPLGDIVISIQTARARAREDRRPLEAELARYLAHGLLHLLGHDHHEPGEARRMAEAEAELLGGVGMVGAALDGSELDNAVPARRRQPWKARASTSTPKRSGSKAAGSPRKSSPAKSKRGSRPATSRSPRSRARSSSSSKR